MGISKCVWNRPSGSVFAFGLATALGGCAAGPSPHPAAARAPESSAPAPAASVFELTRDQLALRDRLTAHQRHLVERIGERNLGKPWELADAADYLVSEWEKSGLAVEYAGYSVDGRPFSNLGVRFEGTELKSEVVDLMVAYDSVCGSKGESAAATTAVLVELARSLAATRFRRTVQLWALGTSECATTPAERGSYALANARPPEGSLLPTREGRSGEKVVLALHLRHLGRFASVEDSPNARRVDVRAPALAQADAEVFRESLDGEGLVARLSAPREGPVGEPWFSDLEPFSANGVPVILVTGLEDEGAIEPDFLALVASRLVFGIGRVGLEDLTNDGMLTPDFAGVR